MEDNSQNCFGRIGIYSGSFDPVHCGHIGFALNALAACGLQKVIFLPEEEPRNKPGVLDISHRERMLELVAEEHDFLKVAVLPQRRFTIDETLPYLMNEYGPNLTMLFGSDVVKKLTYSWSGIDVLLSANIHIAVAMRGQDAKGDIVGVLKSLGFNNKYKLMSSELPETNSTSARSGQYDNLNPKVKDYIVKNELYKTAN